MCWGNSKILKSPHARRSSLEWRSTRSTKPIDQPFSTEENITKAALSLPLRTSTYRFVRIYIDTTCTSTSTFVIKYLRTVDRAFQEIQANVAKSYCMYEYIISTLGLKSNFEISRPARNKVNTFTISNTYY